MARAAGIDGCKGGWVCVDHDLETGSIRARVLKTIWELHALNPMPAHIGIDIPIGLPESGPRTCDTIVRKSLGPKRGSSVFAAPLRAAIAAKSYLDACSIRQRIEGKKYSKQSFMLFPKIAEVDEFMRAEPGRQNWIREVHPEFSFMQLNGATPVIEGKRTLVGRSIREALIRPHFGVAYEDTLRTLAGASCETDDILDAFVAMWTAERMLRKAALVIPGQSEHDACGLRMEMVA